MSKYSAFKKCIEVVGSCETGVQLAVARRMHNNFITMYGDDPIMTTSYNRWHSRAHIRIHGRN